VVVDKPKITVTMAEGVAIRAYLESRKPEEEGLTFAEFLEARGWVVRDDH
jgi:hypothetical protein